MTTSIERPLEWAPPKAAISRLPYLPGLDGMRALAVAAVMVYHANSAWLPGGYLGVEVFFVISGYLITLLLIGEHERTGRVRLGQFYLRRARRLLPALFVLLIGISLYTTLFRRDALGQLRGDVLAALTYVTNWYQIWVGQGYTSSGDFAPLRHLWSLAVEEQFYLIWPMAMMGLIYFGRRRLPNLSRYLVLAALCITVLMALLYYGGPIDTCRVTPEAYWQVGGRCLSKTDTLYLGTITRAGGLLLGAAFAMVWRPVAIMRSPMRAKGRALDVLALLGLVVLGALCWWLYLIGPTGADPWLFRGGFFVCGLATLLVIAAVTHQRSWTGGLLGNPVLLWAGTRSYGLYLYHWPVYQAIRRVAGNPLTVRQFVLALAISCVITELSYRFVEMPIRTGRFGAWWRRLKEARDPLPRRIVATTAAGVVVVSLFAAANLATAELRPNEIAQSLEEGRAATVDVSELLREPQRTAVTRPIESVETTEPATTPPTTEAAPTTLAPTSAVPATTAPTATPTTAAPTVPPTTAPPAPAPPAGPLWAIGDSVMLGAAANLNERGIQVIADVSRQVIDTVPLIQQMVADGQFGGAVVIHLGTNGPPSDETLDAFFAPLAGVPKVIVLTALAPRGWIPETNTNLWEVASRFPNVQILDWATLAAQCPGPCFYDDGIHINPAGRAYYAQLIFTALGI